MEYKLSRIIKTHTAAKERTQLLRAVVLAIRELALQSEPNQTAVDAAAFLALALDNIYQTVDASVAAWEKRGYWVKADRFRMEWTWAKKFADQMREALFVEDWGGVAMAAVQIAQQPQIASVKISPKHRMGVPWQDAWYRFKGSAS